MRSIPYTPETSQPLNRAVYSFLAYEGALEGRTAYDYPHFHGMNNGTVDAGSAALAAEKKGRCLEANDGFGSDAKAAGRRLPLSGPPQEMPVGTGQTCCGNRPTPIDHSRSGSGAGEPNAQQGPQLAAVVRATPGALLTLVPQSEPTVNRRSIYCWASGSTWNI